MHILSKSTYIKGLQCPKALYLYKKHPYLRDKISIEQRARFKRGTDIGVVARNYFPGGQNMAPSSPSQFEKMFAKTMENLSNSDINVMYEAVFIYNDTLIMLDILVRDGNKWKAIEVKSSVSLNETYYQDAALQYYVLKNCGVELSDLQLMYINHDFVKNGEINVKDLFLFKSVIDYAKEHQKEITEKVKELKDIVSLSNAPKINIGTQCFSPYKCDYLGHCWKKIPKDSYLHISAINDGELLSLYNSNITENRDFRRLQSHNSMAINQLEALEQNTYYINYKTFYDLISKKNKSIAFLNILFYRPAIPILDAHKPYQEVVLAYSILSNQNEEIIEWNCLDDYSKMEEGLSLLTETLKSFEKVIYFSAQNINTLMQRYNIVDSKDIFYKISNFRDILKESDFFNRNTKYDFSLKTIYEGLFPDESIFEHSRIILNAVSDSELDRLLVSQDMENENRFLKKIYNRLLS